MQTQYHKRMSLTTVCQHFASISSWEYPLRHQPLSLLRLLDFVVEPAEVHDGGISA